MTSRLFNGFIPSDFSAFKKEKRENPKFNDERKIVWKKMRNLQSYLDTELKRRGFMLEGKVSQYWISGRKHHVNGIWLAYKSYTDTEPYYIVCQLNCGVYEDGFFVGIEINGRASSHLDNVTKYVSHNKDEFLSYVNKLDPNYVCIWYGNWQVGPGKISMSDLNGLVDALNRERKWFELGEWYPATEGFLASAEIVLRIPNIFETLFPLYLVFAGHRPAGAGKTDRLLRTANVRERDLARVEKQLAPEVKTFSDDELDKVIAIIDQRNKSESVNQYSRETKIYRRDPTLSSMLKQRHKDKCQICGASFDVECGFFCDTHHVKPLKAGGIDASDNILVLCPNHHRIFDRSHTEIISRNDSRIVVKVHEQTFEIRL